LNEIIHQKELMAKQLEKEVGDLYDAIEKIGLHEFNLKSTYKWKEIFDGYSGRVTIFMKEGFFKKTILLYDIEDCSCYIKLIDSRDNRLFEAIEEATIWISEKTELIKKELEYFNSEYKNSKENISIAINAYNSLSGATNEN